MDLPTYPVLVRNESYEEDIKTLIGHLRKSWDLEDLIIKKIDGGLSNLLYGSRQRGDDKEEDMILFRVYGDYEKPKVDREREILTNLILHKAGHGQPIYCKFTNGRAYRYNPGKVIKQNEIDNNVERLIARELANIQLIDCEAILKELDLSGQFETFTKEKSSITHISQLLEKIPDTFKDSKKEERVNQILSKEAGRKEIEFLKPIVENVSNKAGITHSDCMPQNMIYDEYKGTVQIIDWEWSSWMNNLYDVGSYLAGLAIGFTVDIQNYPSKSRRHQFIKWYLQRKFELENKASDEVSQEIVEKEDFNVQIFAMVYLLGGIFWLHEAADGSSIDFDFLELSNGFMDLYRVIKEDLFRN